MRLGDIETFMTSIPMLEIATMTDLDLLKLESRVNIFSKRISTETLELDGFDREETLKTLHDYQQAIISLNAKHSFISAELRSRTERIKSLARFISA